MIKKYAKIKIEKLNGDVEEIITDTYPVSVNKGELYYSKTHGITAVGYSITFGNGRQMIIHPNSVYRLTIDEVEEEIDEN